MSTVHYVRRIQAQWPGHKMWWVMHSLHTHRHTHKTQTRLHKSYFWRQIRKQSVRERCLVCLSRRSHVVKANLTLRGRGETSERDTRWMNSASYLPHTAPLRQWRRKPSEYHTANYKQTHCHLLNLLNMFFSWHVVVRFLDRIIKGGADMWSKIQRFSPKATVS